MLGLVSTQSTLDFSVSFCAVVGVLGGLWYTAYTKETLARLVVHA